MNFDDLRLDYDNPDVPARLMLRENATIQFGDIVFKLDKNVYIPIIDSSSVAKFGPMNITGNNAEVLKQWLTDRQGVLLWDYSKVDNELGVYFLKTLH